jgi:hypothetical protein
VSDFSGADGGAGGYSSCVAAVGEAGSLEVLVGGGGGRRKYECDDD